MPFGIQPWHIVVIVLVALIVFGPSKLPELGKSIGKTINEFRTGAREMTESMKEEISKPDPQTLQAELASPIQVVAAPPVYPAPQSVTEPIAAAPGSFCTQCGIFNPADASFCKSCGKKLIA